MVRMGLQMKQVDIAIDFQKKIDDSITFLKSNGYSVSRNILASEIEFSNDHLSERDYFSFRINEDFMAFSGTLSRRIQLSAEKHDVKVDVAIASLNNFKEIVNFREDIKRVMVQRNLLDVGWLDISHLRLTVRSARILNDSVNISIISDISKRNMTGNELKRMTGMGIRSVHEIQEALGRLGTWLSIN